jgi:toxin ParE1/3/4
MRRVRILDEAAEEASEAAKWYESQRPGLGAEFERAVDAALDLLEEDLVPLTAMPGSSGQRGATRLILKRFPYDVVVYESGGDELIVIAFAHQSRRPGYWRVRWRG